MAEREEDRTFWVLKRACWSILALLNAAGAIFGSSRFAFGIAAGGILSLLNLYWLESILVRALAMHSGKAARYSQVRYLLRLGITGIVLYILIVKAHADVFGILAGLSVVVLAVIALTIYLLSSREV